MPIASVQNGSDSEDGYWHNGSNQSDDDYMDQVFRAMDSATNSPVQEPPATPSPFTTPTTERLSRGQYLQSVFSQSDVICPPSPTKPRHLIPKSHGKRRAVMSAEKDGRAPVRQSHESSEDEVAAMLTDTDPSPASSRQSTLLFIDSRTTSMSSIQSQQSSSSSSSGRKRQTEPRESPPSSPTHPSPKSRRRVDDAARTPDSGHGDGSGSAGSTWKSRIQFRPPVEMDDVFKASQAPSANPSLSFGACPSPYPSKWNNVLAQNNAPKASTSQNVPVLKKSASAEVSAPSVHLPVPGSPVSQHAMPTSSAAAPRGPFGVNLDAFIIAHDAQVQCEIDRRHLSWGVQYELARGISVGAWSWTDITPEKLDQLKGPDTDAAPKVAAVVTGVSRTTRMGSSDASIWKELDREQKAIMENRSRGLGLLRDGEWEGVANWYGGQVQQIARLAKGASAAAPYAVRLEPLEKRRSNRFARFLGSRRIVQLRIPQELLMKDGDGVRGFLLQRFVVCGRVFVPFHSKEESVYLVETNQNFERGRDALCGDQFRMSFEDFIEWHNPLRLNANQPMSKWSTRWALGLSTSIPALEFEGKNMHFIKDLWAKDWHGAGKPPAEKIMTDGCGFINGAALRLIYLQFKYRSSPIAVQGRVAGAKGLWVLHPNDKDPDAPPRIWIRESQNKINLVPFAELDRAHRIFDLVGPSRVSMPYYLSMQSILNLSHNGVRHGVFIDLMVDRLNEDVRQLTEWAGANAMMCTWRAVDRVGRVAGMKAQRYASGSSRALGLSGREYGSRNSVIEAGGGGDLFEDESPLHMGRSRFSGAPLSLHESALELIQAGFHPQECRPLYDKLRNILKLTIDTAIKKYRSPILQSAEAFIIPDPGGVLKEGEIYFRSSQPLNDPVSGRYFDTLEGPVIVGRNPIRVPSDMQKVIAVNYPELSEYYDVAIFSTKGSRSLQSLLSGGDSDGDITLMIWDPSFLESFSNATYIPPQRDFISRNFERQVETADQFGRRCAQLAAPEAQKEFQKVLLLGLADLKIGLYSIFHDVTVYAFGYDSYKAMRCAHMFETVLDSDKTGLRVKQEVFKDDRRAFDRPRPPCMAPPTGLASGVIPVPRDHRLAPFILDALMEVGAKQANIHLINYDAKADHTRMDNDLLLPYRKAQSRAVACKDAGFRGFLDELEAIEQHVRKVRQDWASTSPKKQSPAKKQQAKAAKNDYEKLAEDFAQDLPGVSEFITPDIGRVKASFAYQLSSNFGFCVAFKALCAIKADAKGSMPLLQSFGDVMTIPSSVWRALAQNPDLESQA